MASKTSQVSQEITAEQVVEFLEANPDFLDRNPDLITKLRFSHPVQGATSLIERQVKVLREEQADSRQRFEQLAANAELNQKLLEKIERFTIELLDCHSVQPMLSRAHHLLKELFGLGGSEVLLPQTVHENLGKGIRRCSEEEYKKVIGLVAERPAFMGRPPEWLSEVIAEQDTFATGSIAVVPLAMEQGSGFIVLGSKDEMRFQGDMGTDFLTYIAALIGRLLERLEQ
jgi:uncharacterized protein YigA (DUF484 family)